LSPGKLTGLSLDDMVALEELELSDGLGERYRGKLEDGGIQVRVTAFNQAFTPDPSRGEELEDALESHAKPLPAQILALHSYKLDGNPPFTIEEYPTGPSLRTLLEQRKSLDWQTSVRVAANVARAAAYLVENGIFHSCIHPGSIFITDVAQGRVQLGEWAHGVLSHRSSPLAYADEHPDGFFGYAGYMAPETIRDGDDVDQRSIVYVAGMLLYEMIVGKAPFTSKKSEDTLKRHLHEKPLKLAIAKSGADLHPELDDVLDMMWIKAPERRFQNPSAAIGALASLLDTTPDVLAPEISPREEPVFTGPVPGAVDEDEEAPPEVAEADDTGAEDDTPDDAKKTMMGLPSVTTKDEDDRDEDAEDSSALDQEDAESAVDDEAGDDDDDAGDEEHQPPPKSGPSPSIIIEDPELRSAMDGDEEPVDADDAAVSDDASDDVDEPARQTMLMGGQVSESEDDESEDEAEDAAEDDASAPDEEADDEDEVDKPQKDTLMMGGDAGWDALDDEFDSEPEEESSKDEDSGEEQEQEAAPADDDEDADTVEEAGDQESDAADDEANDDADAVDEDGKADEQDDDGGGDTVGKMAAASIGSVEVDDSGGDDMSDDWFGKSTEETWETQQVEAVQEKSENVIRYATIGVLAALVLGVVGFFIFVETGEDSPDESTDAGEATASAEEQPAADEDTEDVDIGRLKSNFDSAISGGRLLSPRANSAIKFLEQLKRHGEDSEEYADARKTFVDEARSAAEDVENEKIYLARNLAGAAAQFSDDEELQAYADDLDKQWREAEEGGADAGASSDDAGKEASENSPAERTTTGSATKRPTASATESAPPKAPPKNTGGSEPPTGNSVSSLLSRADTAKSKGENAEAKRLYREVLDKSSSNSKALSSLGALYFDDAAYSQAAKYYQRAVRASGGNMGYRLRLGMTYYKLGEFTRARDAWQAVLDRDPDNALAKKYIQLVESKIN
jgi:tetratricopeptide (TPR) repeat protein/serine/threonine protein kinase